MTSPLSPAAHAANRPRWHLLLTPSADGATNMALDEALMRFAARHGVWVMRVYGWAQPTLSLGRNQRAAGLYDLERLREAGIAVVRRPTGGRALLHDAEVTYSVTAPVAGAGSLRDVYAGINELLVEGLRSLGADVALAGTDDGARAIPPGSTPCFDRPAPGEIVAAAGKLAGSAQWRDEDALLQHGSILLAGDQAPVSALLVTPAPTPPPPATLAALLGRMPSLTEVAGALFGAVRRLRDPDAVPLAASGSLARETAMLRDRYLDPAWTWRR